MKSFEYAAPKTVTDAAALLGAKWGETEILAGGTDLITSLKQQITAPARLVSLKKIAELKTVESKRGGLRIGAMATLGELAGQTDVKQHFPAVATAIHGIGSPQILSAGTVGGDLCQRPRCWYFRNGHGLLAMQSDNPLVRTGDNRYHAIFGNDGPALFVSPSSLGPALVALEARITLTGPKGKSRELAAAEFFRTPRSEGERETALKPNEILTSVFIPFKSLRNATYEVRHRHGLDWPYATATVAFDLRDGKASDARVVLGHVAPTPWQAKAADKALKGTVDAALAAKAGAAAAEGAKPLSGNAYKVQLVKTAVKRAVMAAAEA
jgi:xanthine dehydrogenase YagS FAD-binding subunit